MLDPVLATDTFSADVRRGGRAYVMRAGIHMRQLLLVGYFVQNHALQLGNDSLHPAATSWNGNGMARGTCTVHSWNDGASEDEAEPRMGMSVNERLEEGPSLDYSSD